MVSPQATDQEGPSWPIQVTVGYRRSTCGGRGSGIDRVVDDPFYGFNEGSVHIRVDGAGEPRLLQFESPLLRLITDEGYQL